MFAYLFSLVICSQISQTQIIWNTEGIKISKYKKYSKLYTNLGIHQEVLAKPKIQNQPNESDCGLKLRTLIKETCKKVKTKFVF